MAAGDALKVWFPEMLEELCVLWSSEMDWVALISMTHSMTLRREALRVEKGIALPVFYCDACEKKHSFNVPPITIRSMLFALKKAALIDDFILQQLDRDWKKHQRRFKLDGAGAPKLT